ncbi:uncharacterized protein HGUI_00112 [Hanseniaspora guilliermondii]|uniref:Rab-GAP TBC domain-containing protein n=1 Tax=Hanseniaspora guilliermondii TaxID=56406 RepID=A0A1L0AUZ0_9ASCO|nr:uncharacterized protein HGUI_00112 [Hanseniaspora guilliermondii]
MDQNDLPSHENYDKDFQRLQKFLNDLIKEVSVLNENTKALSPSTLNQINLDVDRSFNFVTNSKEKELLKKTLKTTIKTILERNPQWFYYQGYHDIVSFFIYYFCYIKNNEIHYRNCDSNTLISYITTFSEKFLRDFMSKNLNNSMVYLKFIPKILKKYNVYNHNIFNDSPFYGSIANIITLFTHNLNLKNMESRLAIITYVIRSENISFILIFYAKLVYHYKALIEKRIFSDEECETDPLIIQTLINTIITEELDNIDMNTLKQILKETLKDMNTMRIQNVFKYSLENKGLLINFNFNKEKVFLKNTLLVAINIVILQRMKHDISSPYTFAGTVLTINNIQKLIRYWTHERDTK